ncbi:MAG TPA: condensation domain-containing protein [Acidobacteriaceae bacterium]|jgi:non-ribosomal peptide synthetase component F/thioesterase domain-containing protein
MTQAPHLDSPEVASQDEIAANHNHHSSTASTDAINRAGEETYVVPASLEQSRYWTLAQIDPGSTASNMAISCEITGPLDALLVEQAIAALTLRHEALRTLFRMVDGHLSQVILTRPLYEFTQQDLSHADGSEVPQADLGAALSAHSHLYIDLAHGPVLRARLLKLSTEQHVLAMTMNHIVCDGWSNGLLLRDLMKIYLALRTGAGPAEEIAAGPASGLPQLPFQFADFTVWQNEYLASERAKDALRFWTSHIRRDLPTLDMPADHPRQAGRSFPGTIASVLLPASLNDALVAYCRKSGSTKHIVLLACFEALCARFSGQRRFLLGSTIANRTQPGMEDIVGRFANPQIIVADVEGDPTFRELETRVRDWETSAYTHQDMPFSRIIEEFQMSQEGAGSQFLQVWFVYQKAFMQPQEIPGVHLTPLRSVSGGVDFDLLVSVVERAEGPRLQIEYNTDLFSAERIEGLLAAFQQMLTAALAHPDRPVSQIALPSSASPSAEAPLPAAAHAAPADLLATVAAYTAARPQAIAIRAGTQRLTWQELDERSQALAAHLVEKDLLNGATRALVVLTPEVESAIALLALIALGERGPRITPLPAHTTADDLSLAAADSSLLLAPKRLMREETASAKHTVAYEEIGTLSPASAAARSQPQFWATPQVTVASDQAAAFVTTDVAFAETLRRVATLAATLHLSAEDALLALPAASPADAFFDLLLAFYTGASLDLVASHGDLALQSLLDERQITAAIAEPAEWRAWIANGWSGDRRLTAIARGRHIAHPGWMRKKTPQSISETIPVRAAAAVLSGPSGPVAVASPDTEFTPLPGAMLSVLAPDGLSVPPGATGELAASSSERTGYLAQSAAGGTFRILGTSNSVVLLHGHRVRLSDLDAALLRLPGVLDATTRMQHREDGAPQLAAWIIARDAADPLELRNSLLATLPQHLVPASLQLTPALPFRLDGSVDATRLTVTSPAPKSAIPAPDEAPSPAIDDVSRELSHIWKDVLNLDAVDPHLPFFEAGGNSLLLVRLFARVNKSFGTRLPITTIFDAGTVAKLSERLRNQGEIRAMVPVQTHGHRPPVFMIHSYLLYQGLSQALGQTQPFYGVRELETDSELNMQERVANYVREIRAVQPHGPYSVMGWCAAGPLTVELARQLIEAGETIGAVILFDSWLPGYLNSVEGTKGNGSVASGWKVIQAKLRRHSEKMQSLSMGQRVRYVRSAVTRYVLNRRNRFFISHWSTFNALANRFRMPLPQFMYSTTLTTFAALHAYRPEPAPIRITLIRAHDSREVPGASAACGWEQVAMHGVEVLWAPGDHETMFLGEKLETTAELVRRCLEDAEFNPMPASASSPASAPPDSRLLPTASL